MTEADHERAERLIDAARIEGVTEEDRRWLGAHLAECSRCAERARATENALRALRSVSVPVDAALVRATQLRVRLHAQEIREQHERTRALWVACAISWLCGAVTAPFLWRGFAWVGERFALPETIWQMGFVLWWIVPSVATAGVIAWQRGHTGTGAVRSITARI